MVKASQQEALLAVDLYNGRGNERLFEAFFVHMHIAWLYLLHAECGKNGVDIRHRDGSGHIVMIDGEAKTWELQKCIEHRWPNQNDPVRRNLEKTIAIRNRIEHRWQNQIAIATSGYAQALILNYESEQGSFEKARTTIGRPDLRLHDLRHTGLTLAAATGATTAELMHRAGHASAPAALRYQHATQNRDRVLAKALGEMIKPGFSDLPAESSD